MKKILILLSLCIHFKAVSKCEVFGRPMGEKDSLIEILHSMETCPVNVLEFRSEMKANNLELSSYMVANRGAHNPKFGSFSIFETVIGAYKDYQIKKGEFYFGHFTTLKEETLTLDQSPREGKLLIELIVFDKKNAWFNFYELIGTAFGGEWHYRGNSLDALKDNEGLKLKKVPGKRMRCSACHNSGGPIMKELNYPHNDWWKISKQLSFNGVEISQDLLEIVNNLEDSREFSNQVKIGMNKFNSLAYLKSTEKSNFKEILRPLFCTTEVNLISGVIKKDFININSEYFISPILLESFNLLIDRKTYFEILMNIKMKFPENGELDAANPWHAPVKGHSNNIMIKELIKKKIIDLEFALDVLAIDFKNNLFSKKRCELLKYVPNSEINFKSKLIENLKKANETELLLNLLEGSRNKEFHTRNAEKYLLEMKEKLLSSDGVFAEIKKLQEKRISVYQDEISKNPLGQILEPGFRVIFPFFPL